MKVVPNIISLFRICLVPVFIIVYFTDESDIKINAVFVYAVAAFSDFLDGFLARKFEVSSNLGKLLDPLGDKLMTFSVLLCLTIRGPLPFWAVLVVGIKEVIMAIGGIVLHKKAHVELLPSNLAGKASTVVFFLVCATLLLFRDIPRGVAIALISFAIGLAFLALVSYFRTYTMLMKSNDSTNSKLGI